MKRPHGIMFHHFHGEGHPEQQGSISESEFNRLLDFYSGDHDILGANEWKERALCQALDDGDVCLTFDDGIRGQYDIALPVLEDRGLTAFWFVYTGEPWVEICRRFRHESFKSVDNFYAEFYRQAKRQGFKNLFDSLPMPPGYLSEYPFYSDFDRRFRYVRDKVLNKEQYKEIMLSLMDSKSVDPAILAEGLVMGAKEFGELAGGGHIVGLHSHTHPMDMAKLGERDQLKEYYFNQSHILGATGILADTMSHPSNSYSEITLRLLEAVKVSLGFRANMEDGYGSLLEMPREDHANIMRRMGDFIRPFILD